MDRTDLPVDTVMNLLEYRVKNYCKKRTLKGFLESLRKLNENEIEICYWLKTANNFVVYLPPFLSP